MIEEGKALKDVALGLLVVPLVLFDEAQVDQGDRLAVNIACRPTNGQRLEVGLSRLLVATQ